MNAHDEALDYLLCSAGATAVDVLAGALKAARAAVKARVRDLDYDSYLEAFRYARSRAEAVNPRWMVSAEDSVSARLPKAWVSFKSMGRTITGCRDVRIPAPRYWPGGLIPDGAEVATPGVYGNVSGATEHDIAALVGGGREGSWWRYDRADQMAVAYLRKKELTGQVWRAMRDARTARRNDSAEEAAALVARAWSAHREKMSLAESVREMA